MLRYLIIICFYLLIFIPEVILKAQHHTRNELDEIIGRIDATFNDVNQTQLKTIERIVQSFCKAFPEDRKFINCLNALNNQIEYNSISNYVTLETNAALQADQVVSISTPLLFQLIDNALFCTKNLASYYVNVTPNEINDLAVSMYKIDTYGTILAWVMAHEIAHAYLEHDNPDNHCHTPANLASSRECELEADRFSFDILNRAGYSLIVLLSYFDINKKYENIQNEMGEGQEESYYLHPNFNTRTVGLLDYIFNSRTYESPQFIFSTYLPGNTRDLPMKMSLILPNQSYCHSGIMLIDNQIIQIGYEYMSDASAHIYYKTETDNIFYQISNIYAHEPDLQVSGQSSFGDMDGNLKVYRDSFIGISVQDDSNVINNLLSINKEDFYRELLLNYISNETAINNGIRSLINMYAISQDLFLQFQKGVISRTIYQNNYDQSKQSLINDLRIYLGDNQINSLLPSVGIF